VELESEGEAGSGTPLAHLVISDKKAKKKKKKRNFRRSKVAQLDRTREAQETETGNMNSRNECAKKCRNHKQSQADMGMLQAVKSLIAK